MERKELPVTRRELGMLLWKKEENITEALQVLQPYLKNQLTKTQYGLLRMQLTNYRCNFWAYRNRRSKVANSKLLEDTYFDAKITFPTELILEEESTQGTSKVKLTLHEKAKEARAQRKVVTSITQILPDNTIPLIRTTGLVKKRRIDSVAEIIKETTGSPGTPAKMIRQLQTGTEAGKQEPFSPEEALALILQLGLTHDKYQILRSALQVKGYKKILPAYAKVLEAKQQCCTKIETDEIDSN